MLGFTINRVSLFALIFSIGILVDDATVVVENVFRRWLADGEASLATAVDAVGEVGNPTIMATLTVVAALLPMGFVTGMMGPYMLPIPVLGSVAMLFSLIAAFVFTPWIAYRLRPRLSALERAGLREQRIQRLMGRVYRPIIVPLIERRWLSRLFLGAILVAFALACSLFYFKLVTVKMLPFDNKPQVSVVIDLPEGSSLVATANLGHRMAERLRRIPEVSSLQLYAGTAAPFDFNGLVRHYYLRDQPWQADIQERLKDKDARERSSHRIAVAVRDLVTPMAREAGARVAVVEMPPGPPVLQTLVAEIYGPTAESRRTLTRDMKDFFERADGVVDVDNRIPAPYERWHFAVDTEKASRYGVRVKTITRNLDMAMGGHRLGDIGQAEDLEPVYLVIQLPFAPRSNIRQLQSLPVPARDGTLVPLSALGRFERRP
jgi:multidrug efflux pump subunit AcrB